MNDMTNTRSINILFHGRLAEVLGRELEIEAPQGCSIADLRALIAANYPHATDALRRRVRACVAGSIVTDSHRIAADDQVEFLPPVSGG